MNPFPRPPPPPPFLAPRPLTAEQAERLRLRHTQPHECMWCADGRHGEGDRLPPGADPRHTKAHVTVHDRRGCMHLCFTHGQKRMNHHSFMLGHSPDCPYHDKKP